MTSTIILASSEPDDKNVGEILVQDMTACLSKDSVSRIRLLCSPRTTPGAESDINVMVPRENGPSQTDLRSRLSAAWSRKRNYESGIKTAALEIVDVLRHRPNHQLWAILNSTAAIDVTSQLLKSPITNPLLIQVWDDPRHLLVQRGLDRWTRDRTMQRFFRLLKQADRVAVIGESMSQEYARYTKLPPVVIRHGLDDSVAANHLPVEPTEFRIGFCGGMYAYRAWRTLQQALDILEWKLGDRDIVLNVVTRHIQFDVAQPARVQMWGWRTVAETQAIMEGCDLLYLPQPFDSVSKPLTQWSFPTKLSTYASTGRPVLVHTPSYGSLHEFCRTHDFGILCDHLDAARLADLIQQNCSGFGRLQDLAESSARIAESVLSKQQFCQSVQSFAGLPLATKAESQAAIVS